LRGSDQLTLGNKLLARGRFMQILVYAVALLMLVSLAIFIKVALFSKRPQKIGLIYVVLAIPLYVIYYADRIPFWRAKEGELHPAREWSLTWLEQFDRPNTVGGLTGGPDIGFVSDPAPAAIVAGLVLVHTIVFQRVGVRRRLERIHDPIANFFAGATAATMIGGILVSTFHWGWPGALIVAGVFALVYLGALALLAAVLEVFLEIGRLIAAWLKRKVFTIATWITRAASFVSSLAGRLGLTSLADKIREETAEQESIFATEQDEQDRKLEDAYVRDRARRRAAASRRRSKQLHDDPPATPEAAAVAAATAATEATAAAAAVIVDTAPTDTAPAETAPAVPTQAQPAAADGAATN
jgi:hypothetical protein